MAFLLGHHFCDRVRKTETLLTMLINGNASPSVDTFKTLKHCYELSYISIYMALCSTESH